MNTASIVALLILYSVLPLFLWTKTRKLAFVVASLYGLKLAIFSELLSGNQSLCHDGYTFHFLVNLARDFASKQISWGWNPYLAAGQPVSIASNFFFWIPAVTFSKILFLFHVDVDPLQYANLMIIYLYLQFCTGTLLVLQLLYKNRAISFLGWSALALGGSLHGYIFQVANLLLIFFLPYLMFFLIHAFKSGRWPGLLFFSLFLGGALNHYNPLYFMLFITTFFSALIFLSWKNTFAWAKKVFVAQPLFPLIGVLLFFTTFSPGLNSFLEMGDFVSPTRGYTVRGNVTNTSVGFQPGVSAPLNDYAILFDRTFTSSEVTVPGHHGFYIGTLPFLSLFLAPILFFRNTFMRALAITGIVLAILGAGKYTPAWGWMINNIPLANALRHSMYLAQWVSWLWLIVAMGGLKLFLNRNISLRYKWFSLALTSFVLLIIKNSIDINTFYEIGCGLLVLALTIPLIHGKKAFKSRVNWVVAILLAFHLLNLSSYSLANDRPLCHLPNYSLKKMQYPSTWQSVCTHCKAFMPGDLWPPIDKEIIWSNPNDDFMLFMQKDFASFFLKYIRPNGLFYGNIFHLLPTKDSWKPDYPDFTRKQDLGPFYMQDSKAGLVGVELYEMRQFLNLSTAGEVVTLPSDNSNQISLISRSTQAGYLLRMENYHSGWKAFVDDTEVSIDRVPPNFQMIPVPAGEHRVAFKFHTIYPMLVNFSTFATILGWALMLYWLKNGARGSFFKTADEIKSKKFVIFLSTALIISILMTWIPLPAASVPEKNRLMNQATTAEIPQLPPSSAPYYDNGHYKNFNVSNAFDDDKNTFWHSPFPAKKLGWIVRHFDTPRNIPTFSITGRLEQSGQSPTDFTVSGSNDGISWDLLGISSTLKWTAGETKLFSINGNKKSYSFYKFDFLDSEDKSFVSVADIKLYEKEADQLLLLPQLSETSLIAEKESKIPAKKIYTSGNLAGYPADYAFDGNLNTMWHSPEPQNTLGWLMPYFSQPVKLDSFAITIRPDMNDQAPDAFYVLGSIDGKTWEELGFSGRLQWVKGETKQFAIKDKYRQYNYYKFDFPPTQGKTFISITDIALFGEPLG